jgi:hypothetical protein
MFLFHFYWLGQRPVMTIYVSVLDHYVFFFVVETNNENSFIKIHQLTLNVWCFTSVQNIFLCHNSNLNFEYGVSNSSTQNNPSLQANHFVHSLPWMLVITCVVKKFLTLQHQTNIPCLESVSYTLHLYVLYSWFPYIQQSIMHTHKGVLTV